ncbi:hypothetical protein DSL72_006759 [Monilinia vaccinii-corymbosi]|uniref:Uncharacterized protein n=1 Tax=Monilinia vaccinii-corymbosi TaxID=61207 RepID=A0A8A3PPY9_9HELO|nr:hypothetical protein DSL72_006759 [Monilinia vaccinii-corymbosi]
MLSKLALVLLLTSGALASPITSAKRGILDASGGKRHEPRSIVSIDTPIVNDMEKRDLGNIVIVDAPVVNDIETRDLGNIVIVDAPVVNDIETRDLGNIVIVDAPVVNESE